MTKHLSRIVPVLVIPFLAIASLGACATSDAAAHASSSPEPPAASDVAPTPTPTGPPALPANVLFRITAKAVQANGATMDMVQTVYAPEAITAADKALLDQKCTAMGTPWQTGLAPGYEVMRSTISATAEPGTAAFNTKTTAPAEFGDTATIAYTGDYKPFQAYCAPGLIVFPGTSQGVAVVAASPTAKNGWAVPGSAYGFSADGNSPIESDTLGPTVMQDCTVQVSAAAIAVAPSLSGWASQAYLKTNGCSYKV